MNFLTPLCVIVCAVLLLLLLQMPRQSRAAGGGGRAPSKRKLAEEFPAGEVLTDTGRKSWKLGAPVGRGGFGLIYLGK